jgi:pyruvate dehydrogenase E2 component (dihydrolipoamide acetyltransferase)
MSAIKVFVPDIGDFKDIPVIEVLVKAGDTVAKDDPLIALESDKATMEVPSPAAGVVKEVQVKPGDKVSAGTLVLTFDAVEAAPAPTASPDSAPVPRDEAPGVRDLDSPPSQTAPEAVPPAATVSPVPSKLPTATAKASGHHAAGPASHSIAPPPRIDEGGFQKAHASPGVRAFARELGVDLGKVHGTGPQERILRDDVQNFVRQAIGGRAGTDTVTADAITGGGALNLLPWPQVDFAKVGEIEVKPLARIKKISGANLARNWVMIPHVTQHDDADITELEALRVRLNKENERAGIKITMLAFLIKACVVGLKKHPDFNASLQGDNLVLKKYFNVGFAADTPNGLVVPVIKNADNKGILEIAQEMSALSARAREGKLGPADMQGGCFSISSLGGIGGTYFTPIINAPEVAILGVCRSQTKPVWDGERFVPRLILPLSLSYDHRVIDGASAARFTGYLGMLLADFRRVML